SDGGMGEVFHEVNDRCIAVGTQVIQLFASDLVSGVEEKGVDNRAAAVGIASSVLEFLWDRLNDPARMLDMHRGRVAGHGEQGEQFERGLGLVCRVCGRPLLCDLLVDALGRSSVYLDLLPGDINDGFEHGAVPAWENRLDAFRHWGVRREGRAEGGADALRSEE